MKVLRSFFTGAVLLLFLSVPVFAAPTFQINPDEGFMSERQEFVLDILIDSDGEEIIKAKSVITFDPTRVSIIKAERNNSLFSTFPADEQSTDNTNGVLMLTGFTQSGTDTLYQTADSADVFARVTFRALVDGPVTFDWEYSGDDEPFKSVIVTDGSPPQNQLAAKPGSANFTIEDADENINGSGATGNSGNLPNQFPNTGISDSEFTSAYIVGGVMIILGLAVTLGWQYVSNFLTVLTNNRLKTAVKIEE